MVDVGGKEETKREAVARGSIFMSPECLAMVEEGTMKKGDVLGVARVAGIMGAKRTSELIPLCHLLNLTKLTVDFEIKKETCEIEAVCRANTTGRTGWRWRPLPGSVLLCLQSMTCARQWTRQWRWEVSIWSTRPVERAGNFIIPEDREGVRTA